MCFSVMVSSGYMPNSGAAGSYGSLVPNFFKSINTVLHSGFISLHSLQQCKKVPFFSTSNLAFIIYRHFYDGHSEQCEVIPHCSFDLHFSSNE